MPQLTYYVIAPNALTAAPDTLHYAKHRGELFISPHVRMSGLDGAARIESRELAEQFVVAIMPRLIKRYGKDTTLNIMEVACSDGHWARKKIAEHSEIIRKRLNTENFAPNKPI